MLAPGDKPPAFDLRELDGSHRSLRSILKEGPALLVFFKSSCPTCQLTMPFVQRIAEGSLRVFAISQDDKAATRAFLEEWGVTLPTLLDSSKDRYPASNAFKIDHVPTFFSMSQAGVVEHSFTGFVKSDLEALGTLAGVQTFQPGERVPALKPG